jgi:hypothetical protein
LVRWSQIHFTNVFSINYVIFITPLPKLLKSFGLEFIFKPFQKYVWCCIALTYFVLFVSTIVGRRVNTISVAFSLLNSLLDQQIPASVYKACSKYNIGAWLLGVIVLASLYRSSIVCSLVQPLSLQPPGTFKELFASNYNISRTNGYPAAILLQLEEIFERNGFTRDASGNFKINVFEVFKALGVC